MDSQKLSELTDEELLIRKKKLKQSKITHAIIIGFLAGILIYGVGSWVISPDKRIGQLIPMLIPIYLIYRLLKNPKSNQELENLLKERGLS